jgi:hypothetical protein
LGRLQTRFLARFPDPAADDAAPMTTTRPTKCSRHCPSSRLMADTLMAWPPSHVHFVERVSRREPSIARTVTFVYQVLLRENRRQCGAPSRLASLGRGRRRARPLNRSRKRLPCSVPHAPMRSRAKTHGANGVIGRSTGDTRRRPSETATPRWSRPLLCSWLSSERSVIATPTNPTHTSFQ